MNSVKKIHHVFWPNILMKIMASLSHVQCGSKDNEIYYFFFWQNSLSTWDFRVILRFWPILNQWILHTYIYNIKINEKKKPSNDDWYNLQIFSLSLLLSFSSRNECVLCNQSNIHRYIYNPVYFMGVANVFFH